ncbi:MAG: MBL fold metallo-hydrolase [Rhodobacteraceae bacterium]|nr:MBL fold metallo-hydrolase [Paracoccaceae bacterium]
MTERGTNTWLLGQGEVTVIDPGPGLTAHLDAILAALDRGERIVRIIVTHRHADHSGLAPALAARTGAPVLGAAAPLPAAPPHGEGPAEGIDRSFRPDIVLADGDVVEAAGLRLAVLHTPGHLGDHICLLWPGGAFSGDHVMGWSSSIVSPPEGDMGAYMASLDRLAAAAGAAPLFPGHGDPVVEGQARIAALRRHRLAREAAIRDALGRGHRTIAAIARAVYADLAPAMLPAASRNVLAHLVDLQRRGLAAAEPDGRGDLLYRIP